MTYLLSGLYLLAIIAANLSIVYFGPAAAIWNAFILISLDLTTRDALHERWHQSYLWPKMFTLIATGSLLSYLLNASAGRIALASFLAFAAAGLSDALIYAAMGNRSRLLKMNGSNIISSIVDSTVFVLIAYLPLIIIPGQIMAKIMGGVFWSLVINEFYRRELEQK